MLAQTPRPDPVTTFAMHKKQSAPGEPDAVLQGSPV